MNVAVKNFVLLDTGEGGRGAEVADAVRYFNGADHLVLPEFDAVYAWTSRDRVIIRRMTAYLVRERQIVFVEMKEMEKHILTPTVTEGIIGVLAWSQNIFVAVKRDKTMLVANMKHCTMMRVRQEEECQELGKARRKNMTRRPGDVPGHDGTKTKFDERSFGGSAGKIFQEIRDLDEKISGEEVELLEKRQILEEGLKGRRSAEVEEGRDTVLAGRW